MKYTVEQFVELVRNYRVLVDKSETLGVEEFTDSCTKLLPRIYAAALDLPVVEPKSQDLGRILESPIKSLSNLFGNKDAYYEVFDPYINEKPVIGLLSDDLADVYLDLVGPLHLYDAENTEDAIWSWKFNFDSHSGDHIVDAMRVLHRLVRKRN